jgi:hypothetical protein
MEDLKSDILDILEVCILMGGEDLDLEGMDNTAAKIVNMLTGNYQISLPE